MGLEFDMSRVEEAPVWLLSMLSNTSDEEIAKKCAPGYLVLSK